MSPEQLAEVDADHWAVERLAEATGARDADFERLIDSIAAGALGEHLAKYLTLAKVPKHHPSLLFRIGSIYEAGAKISSKQNGTNTTFGDRAGAVSGLALTAEMSLTHVVRLPPHERVASIASCDAVVGILTKQGTLYETDLFKLHSPDSIEQLFESGRVHTVRRYGESEARARATVRSLTGCEISLTLAYERTNAYIFACETNMLRCYRVEGINSKLIFTQALSRPMVVAHSTSSEQLSFAIQEAGGLVTLFTISPFGDVQHVGRVNMVHELGHERVKVVGLRHHSLLVHTQPIIKGGWLERLWILAPNKLPRLAVSTAGNLTGFCFSRYGLASFGSPFGQTQTFLDTTPDHQPSPLENPRCQQISDLEVFVYAMMLFEPRGFLHNWSEYPRPAWGNIVHHFTPPRSCFFLVAPTTAPVVCSFSGQPGSYVYSNHPDRDCLYWGDRSDKDLLDEATMNGITE